MKHILEGKLEKHTNFFKNLRARISNAYAKTKTQYDKGRKEVSYEVDESARIRNEYDEQAWPQKNFWEKV